MCSIESSLSHTYPFDDVRHTPRQETKQTNITNFYILKVIQRTIPNFFLFPQCSWNTDYQLTELDLINKTIPN